MSRIPADEFSQSSSQRPPQPRLLVNLQRLIQVVIEYCRQGGIQSVALCLQIEFVIDEQASVVKVGRSHRTPLVVHVQRLGVQYTGLILKYPDT